MSFKCEHVIIANCDFSPSEQLLEHNDYIAQLMLKVMLIFNAKEAHSYWIMQTKTLEQGS